MRAKTMTVMVRIMKRPRGREERATWERMKDCKVGDVSGKFEMRDWEWRDVCMGRGAYGEHRLLGRELG